MGRFSLLQMLLFVHGERHKYVDVQIIDDAIPEGAERFQLILSKPSPGLELGAHTTGAATDLRVWDLGLKSSKSLPHVPKPKRVISLVGE